MVFFSVLDEPFRLRHVYGFVHRGVEEGRGDVERDHIEVVYCHLGQGGADGFKAGDWCVGFFKVDSVFLVGTHYSQSTFEARLYVVWFSWCTVSGFVFANPLVRKDDAL